jgi:hypothetical protein
MVIFAEADLATMTVIIKMTRSAASRMAPVLVTDQP